MHIPIWPQETSRDRLPALFAAARARGLTTSFDTNWDPTERWDGGIIECELPGAGELDPATVAHHRAEVMLACF